MGVGPPAPPQSTNELALLSDEELDRLVLELMSYAHFLLRGHYGWMGTDSLPHGLDAASLALEAITRVLDGRRRDWDPEKESTRLDYLKSVVKSIISSEIVPAVRRSPEADSVSRDGHDLIAAASSTEPAPDEILLLDELKERMRAALDEYEDQLVLECLFDDITRPGDIAEVVGLPVQEVYRIKRKIQRRLLHFQEGV
jgi:hypothetical protein